MRWADKQQQTDNRRTTKKHLIDGKYLGDVAFAQFLSQHGSKSVSVAAVRKSLQRGSTTALECERRGVRYVSGADPSRDWIFPNDWRNEMKVLYLGRRKRNESRIAFFVRELQRKIIELGDLLSGEDLADGQYIRARKLNSFIHEHLAKAKTELRLFKQDEIEEKLSFPQGYQPPAPQPKITLLVAKHRTRSNLEVEESEGCGFSEAMRLATNKSLQEARVRVKTCRCENTASAITRADLLHGLAYLPRNEYWALYDVVQMHASGMRFLADCN